MSVSPCCLKVVKATSQMPRRSLTESHSPMITNYTEIESASTEALMVQMACSVPGGVRAGMGSNRPQPPACRAGLSQER
jgi:hypothetical protein